MVKARVALHLQNLRAGPGGIEVMGARHARKHGGLPAAGIQVFCSNFM
jgi:hypothetical protein